MPSSINFDMSHVACAFDDVTCMYMTYICHIICIGRGVPSSINFDMSHVACTFDDVTCMYMTYICHIICIP